MSGPKPTGSVANEVKAVNYILHQAEKVKEVYGKNQEIIVDHQIVSGSKNLWEMSALYLNLQNIVVKIQGESNDAILLNAHFDSGGGKEKLKNVKGKF